jgi:predicted RNA-binding Zn ribbon-like protein
MVVVVKSPDALPAKKFRLIGGDLCLDYCNTMGGKREGIPRENLHSYLHFLSWCEQAGVVSSSQAQTLKEKAAEDSDKAALVLTRAIELREGIYRIFFGLANATSPSETDLGVLNSELARALGRLRIGRGRESSGFAWAWSDEQLELDNPLGPVAYSAATLLASERLLAHVHQCGGDNCGWLFLDCSKNHSRRWCDMRDCGNRAKVRRHRQKSGAGE